MTDEDYLAAVLNCDDQSGMATDAAQRAVSALRERAERAEAAIERVRELHSPYLSANGLVICAGCGHRWGTCPTRAVMDGAS